jgi:tRNA (guanine26-N2/guanine27-N2)-dimethyltransferase
MYKPYKFTLFEGLSATGLRSIRYAKEIPLLRYVHIAILYTLNSRYTDPVAQMGPSKRSPSTSGCQYQTECGLEQLGCHIRSGRKHFSSCASRREFYWRCQRNITSSSASEGPRLTGRLLVSVIIFAYWIMTQERAFISSVLYSHREAKSRFDVIDLDPYGTAVPFIDGSVQAINDGGT